MSTSRLLRSPTYPTIPHMAVDFSGVSLCARPGRRAGARRPPHYTGTVPDPQSPSSQTAHLSPFVELDRADWAALAPSMPLAPARDRDRAAARARRAARPARGRRGLPAAQPAAEPLRRRHEGAAQGHERVPARARRVHAVRHRRRRLGRGRQVDDRAPAARAARPVGGHAPRRARHDRRLPASRTPSSSGAGSWSARASPSPTTAARCCAS